MVSKNSIAKAVMILAILTIAVFASSAHSQKTWTQAVCDSKNYCEDYTVTIDGDSVTLKPSGYAVQHNKDWNDLRGSVVVNVR